MRIVTGRASEASFAPLKTNAGDHVLRLSGSTTGLGESSAMRFDKYDPVVFEAFSWTKIMRSSPRPKNAGLAPQVTLRTDGFTTVHVEPIGIDNGILSGLT